MSKVITDIYGLVQEIQRQFGCDREVIEALCDRFSENVVIAGDLNDVAIIVSNIAGEIIDIADHYEVANKLLEDPDINFDHVIDEYRDVDWGSVGYSYETLRITILEVWTEEECVAIVKKVLAGAHHE